MASGLDLCAQTFVVVDFAVVADDVPTVFAEHRLRTARDIDDGEARVSEFDMRIGEFSSSIRPSGANSIDHAIEKTFTLRAQIARDSAHSGATLPWSRA